MTEPQSPPTPRLAPWYKRIAAQAIDFLVCAVILMGVAGVMAQFEPPRMTLEELSTPEGLRKLNERNKADDEKLITVLPLVFSGIGLAYFSILEASKLQGTVGKFLLGIRVSDTRDQRISWLRSLGRNACKALSAVPFAIGFFMVFFTTTRQTLHDLLTGCQVFERS